MLNKRNTKCDSSPNKLVESYLFADLKGLKDFIRQKVEKVEKERWTHTKLSAHLQQAYPEQKGVCLLERICSAMGIHKTARLSEQELDEAVTDAIAKVRINWCNNCKKTTELE